MTCPLQPFKPQLYPKTNSSHWSPFISFKNWLREFIDQSSAHQVIISLILEAVSLDHVLTLLGEN